MYQPGFQAWVAVSVSVSVRELLDRGQRLPSGVRFIAKKWADWQRYNNNNDNDNYNNNDNDDNMTTT